MNGAGGQSRGICLSIYLSKRKGIIWSLVKDTTDADNNAWFGAFVINNTTKDIT